jgi:NAD-dependent SIR2 family protein deacetylase
MKHAKPTIGHRSLVELWRYGKLQNWVQQNHDGLPQKAGFPQECINEIH